MNVSSYLFYEGQCQQALDFYRDILDIEIVELMHYADSPEPVAENCIPPGSEGKVMHCSFRLGDSLFMASDGMCSGKADLNGFAISLAVDDVQQAQRLFDVLGRDGEILMPLDKTFFAERFGMVKDRFGMSWMIHAAAH